jgi:hypothetical protein
VKEKNMTDHSPTFVHFNPTNNPDVQNIKQRTDELIEICHSLQRASDDPESKRRAALAITNYEQAAMWAVKSLFS